VKNYIKIIAILGMVAFVFPVYSAELSDFYKVSLFDLKEQNPLLHQVDICCGPSPVSSEHPLHEDRALALTLTAAKVLQVEDEEENEETLQTVCRAVCEGAPVTSEWIVRGKDEISHVLILPSKEPTSIFTLVEDLVKNPPLFFTTYNGRKKGLWMEAVFQGHRERQEKFANECNELRTIINDQLKNKISEDLINLIVSYSSKYYTDAKETALIKQAQQKFDEEQQAQPSLNEKLPIGNIPMHRTYSPSDTIWMNDDNTPHFSFDLYK